MADGFSEPITRTFKITDSGASASMSATGVHDINKTQTIALKINKDSGVAGLGVNTFTSTAGSSLTFTSSAAAWTVWKFGSETQVGGILQKADGSAFTVAQLPDVSTPITAYGGVIAFCSNGVRICKYDGSAWQQLSVAN